MTSIPESMITNQTDKISFVDKGWRINLEGRTDNTCSNNKCKISGTFCGGSEDCLNYCAERIVTNSVATTSGVLFANSFAPTADVCNFGGNSYLWAINYDTGAKPSGSALFGKAIIQVSTGTFLEQNFTDMAQPIFTEKLSRRSSTVMSGKPPVDQPLILNRSQNQPVRKILHVQEK